MLLALLACMVSATAPVGDGKQDDTKALQALIDAGDVFLPRPSLFYRITDTLRIGSHNGLKVQGDGQACRIIMDASDKPIVAFTAPSSGVLLQGLSLEYAHKQSAEEDPRSIAVAQLNEDGKDRTGGLSGHTYRDLWVVNATKGFSVLRDAPGDATSVNPWSGSRWERLVFQKVGRSLIDLNLGKTEATGNSFQELLTMKGGNDGLGTALDLQGEAELTAIDIEDWTGRLMYVRSGSVTLRGLHAERYTGTGRLIEIASGRFDGSGIMVQYVGGKDEVVLYFGPGATGEARATTTYSHPGVSVTESNVADAVK